jgi:hypothetical protein
MVQTHGLVQLSLGAATINGVINAYSKFTLQLTLGADGSPREATQTSLQEVFHMMEAKSRKVWICLAKGSNGKHKGSFLSVVEAINDQVGISWLAQEHRFTGGSDEEDARRRT